ncbi:hypothetical protein FN846DRAFT_82097 [Sphaerosporella brunnea]|uniref:Uncharacterized protein n=1 Tax=Sphaerosporella brunnea TaxID=1250544 RepID=A0A5J5F9N2_9PEZI|nr:hypothetical protein FN846DRAFT_82097 [Sphaerosporella brunnea]
MYRPFEIATKQTALLSLSSAVSSACRSVSRVDTASPDTHRLQASAGPATANDGPPSNRPSRKMLARARPGTIGVPAGAACASNSINCERRSVGSRLGAFRYTRWGIKTSVPIPPPSIPRNRAQHADNHPHRDPLSNLRIGQHEQGPHRADPLPPGAVPGLLLFAPPRRPGRALHRRLPRPGEAVASSPDKAYAPPPTEPAGETTTPNVTRLLCNARRVCSIVDFAERSTQAKGFEPLSGEQRLRLAHTLYYIWICVEASKDDAELAKYSRLLDPTELRVASDLLMWIYAFSCPGFRRAVLADFPRRWQPTLRKLHGLLKIRHPGQFVVPGTTPEDFFCSSQRAA